MTILLFASGQCLTMCFSFYQDVTGKKKVDCTVRALPKGSSYLRKLLVCSVTLRHVGGAEPGSPRGLLGEGGPMAPASRARTLSDHREPWEEFTKVTGHTQKKSGEEVFSDLVSWL